MDKRSKSTPSSLTDPTGRRISYLRISLTERCNLRCGYCYSPNTSDLSRNEPLTKPELYRLIEAFSHLGIDKIRFTGGEPLLRSDFVEIVEQTTKNFHVPIIGLTTNGVLLKPILPKLIGLGLNRLNISLDSLIQETFQSITGCDSLHTVLDAISMAEQSGAFPFVKVNTVVMKDINSGEINDMARWALQKKIDLRFIEYMPTQNNGWGEERFIPEDEMRQRIELDLIPVNNSGASSGPARTYQVPGYPGRLSFISAVSHKFCRDCNRLRLTSTGQLIGCLFREQKIDLKKLLRMGSSIEDISDFIQNAIAYGQFRKPYDSMVDYRPSMVAVGG
ncbi:GTP 3',8-cyclase MoaA [candidate division LCP-89 bacterium B3_LCP]|uniref:GTP 3',8-cyclase n=1 Tax=candidate division LCP-89 bacterium B3_LCP TaxID=2012998 RepID=A0A532UW29_UNCL8|nr:MAG: GTP 3',8-cyclase MoaA [candidate division LCP-89 bacterium B3_LCP]